MVHISLSNEEGLKTTMLLPEATFAIFMLGDVCFRLVILAFSKLGLDVSKIRLHSCKFTQTNMQCPSVEQSHQGQVAAETWSWHTLLRLRQQRPLQNIGSEAECDFATLPRRRKTATTKAIKYRALAGGEWRGTIWSVCTPQWVNERVGIASSNRKTE